MNDYHAMCDKLGTRQSRKMGNNTYLQRRDYAKSEAYAIALLYHSTDVVTWHSDGRIELFSGGWHTFTTKERINWYLPGVLYQKRGQWIVTHGGTEYLFADGMTLYPDGRVTGGESMDRFKANLKLRQRAQRYAKSYVVALRNGKVPAPSNGDCWYCLMRESQTGEGTQYGVLHEDGHLSHEHKVQAGVSGRTLGEMSGDPASHILSHIEDKYYVPSLLVRALEVMPASIAMKDQVGRVWARQAGHAEAEGGDWPEFIWGDLAKTLGRYVVRQLGQAS